MSNLSKSSTAEACAPDARPEPVVTAYPARLTELGALKIRRALPIRERRVVGPWCFLDRYGPLSFTSEKPMDVAPHPHIGLQTVTWLVQGEIIHHDSLGSEGLVRPGELSLMTAGRGISHSEETPAENSGKLSGVQLWVALPGQDRDMPPEFSHHRAPPLLELPGGRATVILGALAGQRSPGKALSPLVGADLAVHKGQRLVVPLDARFEHALLVLDGDAHLDGQPLAPDTLYYLGMMRDELPLASREGARLLLVGGEPFGESILMWWNFVARSSEEIAAARLDWEQHERFGDVKAYNGSRLRAPDFIGRPVRSS
jgi:redox-sensitive bicupin YhaK (pirin superfamily)